MFWWCVPRHTEWVADDPARTHHFCCNSQNFEKLMLVLTYFDLKLTRLLALRGPYSVLWKKFATFLILVILMLSLFYVV